MKDGSVVSCVISWLFLGYFVILFAERIQSIVRILRGGGAALFSSPFDSYVNLLVLLSIAATIVLLCIGNGGFWRSLFVPGSEVNASMLTITAGVALLSGMVHTEHTIAPIQFGAYGLLIVAMILQTATAAGAPGADRFGLWYSLIYLTVFSMAIPVVYKSAIPQATLFHILEAVVSVVLVVAFTLLLRQMFLGQGNRLLLWAPIIIAAVGDALIIWMRWKEEVNWFVLIFAALSVFLFALGRGIAAIRG